MFQKLLLLASTTLLLSPWIVRAQTTSSSGSPGVLSKVRVENVDIRKGLDKLRERYADHAAEAFEERGQGEEEEGDGYAPFKRIEWFLQTRMSDDGTYPVGALWNAFVDKLAARQSGINTLDGANAARWTDISPDDLFNPYGDSNKRSAGRMLDLAFDPANPNVIYAGAASGGLWKSTDDGASWTPVDDKLPVLSVSCIVVDPNNSGTLYIGTGEGYGNLDAIAGVGILKSTNGGANWFNTGLSAAYSDFFSVNELVIDPNNSNVLVATTNSGIYRTTNAGATWAQSLPASRVFDIVVDPGNSNRMFATVNGPGPDGGIYISADNGANWTQLGGGLPAYFTFERSSLAISASNPQVLYATFGKTDGSLLGAYRTTDGGANWVLTATSPNFFNNQAWYDNVTGVDPANPNTVYVGGVQLWKSVDGGVNWTDIDNSFNSLNGVHVDFHALEFHNGKLYTGSDGGVHRSTDGGATWANIGKGLHTLQHYKMGGATDDPDNLMGGHQDNGQQHYHGNPALWNADFGGDGMESVFDPTNSNIIYLDIQNGFKWRSTNGGGTSWEWINNGTPPGPWVTPLAIDPGVPTTLYTIGNNNFNGDLYRTTDRGDNWSLLFDAPEDLGQDIKVAPTNSQIIYVLGRGALYYTADGGGSFALGSGLPTSGMTYVNVDPTNAQVAYVTRGEFNAGSHLFKTTNGGATWSNTTSNLPNIPANTVAIDPQYPGNVYVGTDLGVYLSTDGGATWSDWNDNLPNVVIAELEIHAGARLIRAATHGRGLWEAHLFDPTQTQVSAVILATNSAEIRQKARILSGDVVVNTQGSGPGPDLLVRENATTPSGYSVKASRITIYKNAVIGGDVYANALANAGTIGGTFVTPLALPVFQTLPQFHTASPGTQDIIVPFKKTQSLPAGQYRDLTVTGTLTLTGGTYEFRSVSIKQNATVRCASGTELKVLDGFDVGTKAYFGPQQGSPINASDIVAYVGGTGTVTIAENSVVYANLYVPSAALQFNEKSSVTGAFIARDVTVKEKAEVSFSSAFSGPFTKRTPWALEPQSEDASPVPVAFALSQNYPNPFNPSTKIGFALPGESRATLKVFDVLGREVATLVDENLPAGLYTSEWNARDLASGIYFYRLQAGSFVETRKLMLLR